RVSPKRPAVPATGAANARRGRLSSTPAAHSVQPHENLAPDAGGPRSGPRFGPRRAAHSVRMTKPTRPDRRQQTGETPPTDRGRSLQLRLFEDLHAVVPELDHAGRLQRGDKEAEVPSEDRQQLVVADVAGRDDQQPPRRRPEPVAVP